MSAYEQIKTAIDRALNNASLSAGFSELRIEDCFDEQLRNLQRELPYLFDEAIEAIPIERKDLNELRRRLIFLRDDTLCLLERRKKIVDELRDLSKASPTNTDVAQKIGSALLEGGKEVQQLRQRSMDAYWKVVEFTGDIYPKLEKEASQTEQVQQLKQANVATETNPIGRSADQKASSLISAPARFIPKIVNPFPCSVQVAGTEYGIGPLRSPFNGKELPRDLFGARNIADAHISMAINLLALTDGLEPSEYKRRALEVQYEKIEENKFRGIPNEIDILNFYIRYQAGAEVITELLKELNEANTSDYPILVGRHVREDNAHAAAYAAPLQLINEVREGIPLSITKDDLDYLANQVETEAWTAARARSGPFSEKLPVKSAYSVPEIVDQRLEIMSASYILSNEIERLRGLGGIVAKPPLIDSQKLDETGPELLPLTPEQLEKFCQDRQAIYRDPNNPVELRYFCRNLIKSLAEHERGLNCTDLGQEILRRGKDYTSWVEVAWHHFDKIADGIPHPPFKDGPYKRTRARAALDEVVKWCDDECGKLDEVERQEENGVFSRTDKPIVIERFRQPNIEANDDVRAGMIDMTPVNTAVSAPPEGAIYLDAGLKERIWIRDKPLRLTGMLRRLLSHILKDPRQSESTLISTMGWETSSHLHRNLATLRNRLKKELRDSGWRFHLWSEESHLLWEWKKEDFGTYQLPTN